MAASCVRVLLCTLGLAPLALSAAIKNDAVQPTDVAQITPSCNLFYRVQSGDTCWDIVSRNDNTFTMRQLLCWNPDINPWCSNLIPGRDVCVGVLSPGPIC